MIALDDNGRVILTDEIPDIRQFVVREITEVHEFEELFHLRYRVYRESRLASFCPTSESEVDINAFDLTSRHLGLFLLEGRTEQLVGCCRGVTDVISPCQENVEEAALLHDVDLGSLPTPRYRYPCLASLPEGEKIAESFTESERSGMRFIEATRLCVLSEFRTLALVRFLVESMFAFFIIHLGLDIGICYVARSQRRFYEAFGCRRMPGFDDQFIAHSGLTFTPLCVTANEIAPDKLERIEVLAAQFDLLGVARLESTPVCVPVRRDSSLAAA